jgi:hypothetical protein
MMIQDSVTTFIEDSSRLNYKISPRFGPAHAKQVRNCHYFTLVLLSQTNRKTGYLRTEDREISIDEESKFGPRIVGYMIKRSVSGPNFALF